MKIDTTLPPIRYEEVPSFQDESVNQTPPPPVSPKPVTPKTNVQSTAKPASTTKTIDTKPKTSGSNPDKSAKPITPAAEKPKGKKVII